MSMSMSMPRALLLLPPEVLVQILACLSVPDLFAVQRTCHRIRSLVADTTYLQYILRTQINGVDDFLPPGLPYSERLKLLRRHERSWSGLRFNRFTEFQTSVPQPDCFTLRDGYLIYEDLRGTVLRYGYTDLSSVAPDEDVDWVPITMDSIRLPLALKVVFAVDHDLVVTMSKQDDDGVAQLQLTFSKFTTGVPHPLSAPTHTISLPAAPGFDFADMNMEVLGDHVLTSVRRQSGQASFYLVSWKTGSVTLLRESSDRWTPLWGGAPKLAVIDGDLIALIKDSTNSLEVCRLETAAPGGPRLRTVCFLELPPLTADASGVVSAAIREWVPTSRHHHHQHAASVESSRRRHVPFYSSAVGTMALSLDYRTYEKGAGYPFRCTMIISVVALLAAVRSRSSSDERDDDVPVAWADWGPSGTRMFERTLLRPAGPFWITNLAPLAVRDYDPLRARCTEARVAAEDTSPSPSRSRSLSMEYSSTEVVGGHWTAGRVETRLPYRDVVADDLDFGDFSWIMADREWLVGILTLDEGTSVTVYHMDLT